MQTLSREQIAGMLATIAGQIAAAPAKPSSVDILRRLAAPFAVEAVSWRIGPTNSEKTKGKALAYIDSRDVQARLDDVLGPDWQDTYEAMPDGSYCCAIGVKLDDEWRWRSDGAVMLTSSDNDDAKEMAQKGSYSDAFKRAAVKWGVGRYLYAIDAPWVEVEKRGNSVVLPERSEAVLRKWLATWMQRNGHGPAPADPQPHAPQPEPKKEPPKAPTQAGPPAAPAAVNPTGPIVPAAGEPVAATLIDGIPHNEGLRAITQRFVDARKAIETNTVLPDAVYGKPALDAAYSAWDAWRRSMWPSLPEAEQQAVTKALDGWSKIAKRFDAALAKRAKERAQQAQAAGADLATGELPEEAA